MCSSDLVEMAPRLAAYKTMVENGHSELDAADYAGGVTVDFNMRGANEWVRAAYLFFNPAVQGTAQLVKLARDNPKRFAAAGGGLFALGFLLFVITFVVLAAAKYMILRAEKSKGNKT